LQCQSNMARLRAPAVAYEDATAQAMMDNLKPLQKTLALATENLLKLRESNQLIMLEGTYTELKGMMARKTRPLSMTLKAKLLLLTTKAKLLLMTWARAF